MAMSTIEAELMGICNGICEGCWLVDLLEELGEGELVRKPVQVNTDSQAAVDWINCGKHQVQTKHINRKYHFVRDEVEKGSIKVCDVNGRDLEADLLTKDLSRSVLLKHMASMGLQCGEHLEE